LNIRLNIQYRVQQIYTDSENAHFTTTFSRGLVTNVGERTCQVAAAFFAMWESIVTGKAFVALATTNTFFTPDATLEFTLV